jgi:hypothetical protein
VLDLVGPLQGAVDAPHHLGDAVDRVQALVGIGLTRGVGVGRHLPARQVDGLEPGSHHLHGLVAGQGPEGVDIGLGREQLEEPLGAHPGQGVVDAHRAAQALDVGGGVGAHDAVEAVARLGAVAVAPGLHLHREGERHGRSYLRLPVRASKRS